MLQLDSQNPVTLTGDDLLVKRRATHTRISAGIIIYIVCEVAICCAACTRAPNIAKIGGDKINVHARLSSRA